MARATKAQAAAAVAQPEAGSNAEDHDTLRRYYHQMLQVRRF